MKAILLLLTLGLAAVPANAQSPPSVGDTIFVSDRFITDTSTTGAEIHAKFRTAVGRRDLLRLDAPVVRIGDRLWVLEDMLVQADFNGNGYVAIWRVAGPRAVIRAHLDAVRELTKDRDTIYDHGIRYLSVRCACD